LDNIHRKRKAGYVQELYNRLKSTKLFIPPTEEEVDLFMKMETNTCLAAQAFKSIYTVNQQVHKLLRLERLDGG